MFALFAQTAVSSAAVAVPIVAIVMALGFAIVQCVMVNWRKRKESEDLAVLKQQMLDRGMSAEEIVRIAEAGTRKPDKCG